MVSTIVPMVHREQSRRRAYELLVLHTVGYVLGGVAIGTILGAAGAMLAHVISRDSHKILMFGIPTLLSLICSAGEIGLINLEWPQSRWAVPANWRVLMPRTIVVWLYGFLLGLGWITRVPVGTFYVAAAWSFACGKTTVGALTMATFGLGRALPVLWLSARWQGDFAACLHDQVVLGAWKSPIRLVNALALASAGMCLCIVLLKLRWPLQWL